jgi:hypothetical protein
MLHSQGCDDEPLLEICEDDALTFVRIVDDGDGPTAAADEVSSDEEEDLSESESSVSGGDQPSSSEEEEFEG